MPLSTYEAIAATADFTDFLLHVLKLHVKNGVFYFRSTPARMANFLSICPMHKSKIGINYTILLRRNFLASSNLLRQRAQLRAMAQLCFATQGSLGDSPKPMASPRYRYDAPRRLVATLAPEDRGRGPDGREQTREPRCRSYITRSLQPLELKTFIHFLRLNGNQIDLTRLTGVMESSSVHSVVHAPITSRTMSMRLQIATNS